MPDADADEVPAAYEKHLAAFGPTLPDDVRRLTREISLHEGLVQRVELMSGTLEVLFRAGDQETGYFDARLRYGSVDVPEADEQFLKGATGRRDIELLYDEFDSSDDCWVHRMLFWPYHEVSVRFAALELEVAPAAGRFGAAQPNSGCT